MPKNIKYPCGVCFKNCTSSCIFCDKCESWMHYKCEKLSKKDFLTLSNSPIGYVCLRCCNVNAVYDFNAALKRLQESSESVGSAHERGIVEQILIRMQILPHRIKDMVSGYILWINVPFRQKLQLPYEEMETVSSTQYHSQCLAQNRFLSTFG